MDYDKNIRSKERNTERFRKRGDRVKREENLEERIRYIMNFKKQIF